MFGYVAIVFVKAKVLKVSVNYPALVHVSVCLNMGKAVSPFLVLIRAVVLGVLVCFWPEVTEILDRAIQVILESFLVKLLELNSEADQFVIYYVNQRFLELLLLGKVS